MAFGSYVTFYQSAVEGIINGEAGNAVGRSSDHYSENFDGVAIVIIKASWVGGDTGMAVANKAWRKKSKIKLKRNNAAKRGPWRGELKL